MSDSETIMISDERPRRKKKSVPAKKESAPKKKESSSKKKDKIDSKDKWKRQSDFTDQDIKDRLKGFKKVMGSDAESLLVLEPGMQVRWIAEDRRNPGKKSLRMGGVLTYVDDKADPPRFLRVQSMVSKTIKPFSVQIKDSEIYYRENMRKDPRFEELVEQCGDDPKIVKELGRIAEDTANNLEKVIEYCDRHKLTLYKMVKQHQKMRRKLESD